MKIVGYSLTAILLAGLGIGWQPPVAKPRPPVQRVGAAPAVFVDTSRLLPLHPAYRVLKEMERACDESEYALHAPVLSTDSIHLNSQGSTAEHPPASVSRAELETLTAESAVSALHEFELCTRASVRDRLEAMRSTLMAGADSSMASERRSAEEFANRTMRAVDQQYASDRLNFRLKTLALSAAAGSAGIDRSEVEMRLHRIQSQLEKVEEDCACEKDGIAAVVDGKMYAMREAAAAAVDEKLTALRRQEEQRVSLAILEARDEILTELDRFEPAAAPPASVNLAHKPRSASRPPVDAFRLADARVGPDGMKKAAACLRKQIDSDIRRVVRELAAEQGINVTFVSDKSRADGTKVFYRLISGRNCCQSGPVLSAVFGS